jgi:hypothetical protein
VLLPIFVSETKKKHNEVLNATGPKKDATISLPLSLDSTEDDIAFLYFFQSFLPKNILTSNIPFDTELLSMAKRSKPLRDVVQAIGELHRGQQNQLSTGAFNKSRETYQALQAYDRSVRSVKDLIATKIFLSDPSALWTTFLLGLFEVRGQ